MRVMTLTCRSAPSARTSVPLDGIAIPLDECIAVAVDRSRSRPSLKSRPKGRLLQIIAIVQSLGIDASGKKALQINEVRKLGG